MKKFKISVIIPVYNVEEYLEETILSVVNQTLGFENIQMILVNDGSPDNSESICLKYKEMYPENVIYIKQENSGVSAARNNGIKYATGEFINFLDSDDKYSLNAYKVGYDYLVNNCIDMVCFPLKFFDAVNGEHYLNFKFEKGTRVIDLTKEPMNPVYHVTSVLIRKELIKNTRFDTKLKISEDVKFLCELLVKTKKLGVIDSEYFYYRKRKNGTSAIQNSQRNPSYYLDTPIYCYKFLLNLRDKNKKMADYLSFVVVYDLKWRIVNIENIFLPSDVFNNYRENIRELLNRCDDRIICGVFKHDGSKALKKLMFKYKESISKFISIKNEKMYFKNIFVSNLSDLKLNIYNFRIENSNLIIECNLDLFPNDNFNIYAKLDDKYYLFTKKTRKDTKRNLYDFDNDYEESYFEIIIPLGNYKQLKFYLDLNNKKYMLNFEFTKFSKLNKLKNSFYKKDGYLLTYKNNVVFIEKNKCGNLFKYLYELLFVKKTKFCFLMLLIYYLSYPLFKNNYWLLCDREDVGGDNAEALFRYIRKNKLHKNTYFCINKNSKDVSKLKSIGKVVYFNSLKYYLLTMHAQLTISSHADNFITSPFGGNKQIYLNPFISSKFVFLQHGITIGNFSEWLRKDNKNLAMFISSADKEYKSLLQKDYMYDKNVIKLTGMPRYDLLLNERKEKNIIALCPTWRKNLVCDSKKGSQKREYSTNFNKSEWFNFYNDFINNDRLNSFLEKNNFKIEFCLHPSFSAQIKDFKSTKNVLVTTMVDYPAVFKKSKIMITDYSSVAFDFAYMKKPVIYTQFDAETYYDNHTYTSVGYYNFKNDGFGNIVYDVESAVDELVYIVKNKCIMEKKFQDRVDDFFKYKDAKNCERVYNELLKLIDKEN